MKQTFKKMLERLIYVLLRAVFGTVRRRHQKIAAEKLSRVLVLRCDKLGDMVLTTAVFNYLNAVNPSVRIDVIASTANRRVIENDERLAEVILYQPTLRGWLQLWSLRRRRYDLILSLVQNAPVREGLMASLIAQPETLKVSLRHKAYYFALFNKMVEPPAHLTHAVEQMVYVASQAIDSAVDAMRCEPKLSYEPSETVAGFLEAETHGKNYMLVNLSAGHSARMWPQEKYISLLHGLSQKTAMRFVLLCTDKDRAMAMEILSHTGNIASLFPPTENLSYVFEVIARSSLVMTPDTGIVHIAAAFGRPVVDLYGHQASTTAAMWLPYHVPHRLIQPPEGEPTSSISVEYVAAAVESLCNELARVRPEFNSEKIIS